MIRKTLLGVAALAAATLASGTAHGTIIDINLAGYTSVGPFSAAGNTRNTFNLGPSAVPLRILSVEFIDLNFNAINGSWREELVISLNQSSDTGAAGTFWDYNPADGLNSPGSFSGSGSFPAPSPLFVSGPFNLLADNTLLVYVYEIFDDGGPTVTDAVISSGTLRVTYAPIPEPSALALLAPAGLALTRRRR